MVYAIMDIGLKQKFKSLKKHTKKPFAGILLEPMEKPLRIVLISMAKNKPESIEFLAAEASNWINEQRIERLAALAEHYGVKGTDPRRCP